MDQALPVYVYNSEHATVRLVEIRPSSQWRGEGVLGCQVGDGFLHHIPSLTDSQKEIVFKPSACYVVSSRDQSKRGTPKKEKEKVTQAGQATEQEMKKGQEVVEEEEEDAELPSMVRWTDSSNKRSAVVTATAPREEVVAEPKNHLLNELEQETQRALAQQ